MYDKLQQLNSRISELEDERDRCSTEVEYKAYCLQIQKVMRQKNDWIDYMIKCLEKAKEDI